MEMYMYVCKYIYYPLPYADMLRAVRSEDLTELEEVGL